MIKAKAYNFLISFKFRAQDRENNATVRCINTCAHHVLRTCDIY